VGASAAASDSPTTAAAAAASPPSAGAGVTQNAVSRKRPAGEQIHRPLAPALRNAATTFSTHGYLLQHGAAADLAPRWMQLTSQLRDTPGNVVWERKRNGFTQANAEAHAPTDLLERTEQLALAQLRAQGVPGQLERGDVKLLRTANGKGEQEVHMDVPEAGQARACYTFLIYLTATDSTALCQRPLTETARAFRWSQTVAALQLPKHFFDSFPVDAGDTLLFRADAPHYGVANRSSTPRFVLFMSFHPAGTARPDTEQQRYPHGVVDP